MTLGGYTIYKDIKQFPAGSYYMNSEIVKYWDLDMEGNQNPHDDDLADLISSAVNLRKRSDVSVGTYLSGGLDSTILTYLLKPNHTWTVGFPELNEFDWTDTAAKQLNSQHHKVIVTKHQFLEIGKWMISKRKEPLCVPNEI